MDTRGFLEGLEARLAAGEAVDVEVSLILVAGQDVPLEDHEASGARRRAVQLLAAGGDPRRELEPDGRAVTALAKDLDKPERRAELARGLEALRSTVDGLPEISIRLTRLESDDELLRDHAEWAVARIEERT